MATVTTGEICPTSVYDRFSEACATRSATIMRIALGVVFLWFGALKLFPTVSPAEVLAGKTLYLLTMGLLRPAFGVPLLGVLECAIGLLLLFGIRPKLAIGLILFHMAGTLTPLVLLPQETFRVFPFEPTLVGQYILKNMVLIAGALVVAGSQRPDGRI